MPCLQNIDLKKLNPKNLLELLPDLNDYPVHEASSRGALWVTRAHHIVFQSGSKGLPGRFLAQLVNIRYHMCHSHASMSSWGLMLASQVERLGEKPQPHQSHTPPP